MATCPTTTRQLSRNDFVQTGPNVDVEQTRRIKSALKVRSDCTQLSPFVSADCSNALLAFLPPQGRCKAHNCSFLISPIPFQLPTRLFNPSFPQTGCFCPIALRKSLDLARPRFQTLSTLLALKSSTPVRKRTDYQSPKMKANIELSSRPESE